MQDVAPSAVRMADATEAMICTTHLIVSFLVIRVSFFYFGTDYTDFHCFIYSAEWSPQASGLAQPPGLAPKYSRERLYFGA